LFLAVFTPIRLLCVHIALCADRSTRQAREPTRQKPESRTTRSRPLIDFGFAEKAEVGAFAAPVNGRRAAVSAFAARASIVR